MEEHQNNNENNNNNMDWKALPKIELHCHLEGAMRLPTIKKHYKRLGLELPSEDDNELFEYFIFDKPVESLKAFLDKFQRSQIVFRDEEAIEEVTQQLILDKHQDGVKLLEIRYSPCHIQRYCNLSLDTIHQAVLKGMKKGIELCNNDIEVGLICIAEAGTSRDFFMNAFKFALRNKDTFVGFDNAGAEVNLSEYKEQFDQIHEAGLSITIHASEDLFTGNPQNAIDAVEKLHATRIGHGIQIFKYPQIVESFINKGILLEISPTSNLYTGSVESFDQHPMYKLYKMGLKVCPNTDDPGCFSCELSDEYQALNKHFDFGVEDFKQMNRWALEHSFLDSASKKRVENKYFYSN